MIKPTFLLLLLVFLLKTSYGQISTEKNIEKIQEADEFILSENYDEALFVLNALREGGSENPNLDYKTGLCYLNTVTEKSKALPFLKQASLHISKNYNNANSLEENAPVEAMLLLGDAYRNNNNFIQAVKCYKNFQELINTKDKKSYDLAKKRIRECHIAKVLQNKPVDVKYIHLDNTINQGIANLNQVVSADGKMMVFTRKMKFYDAIYISHYNAGKWEEPENITTQLGSDGEFFPTSLSSDGKKILLSSYEMLTGHDIYESEWAGSRWSKRKKLDDGVNSNFFEIHASYSPDGNTIFFASNRDKGYGGFDIYKSERRADNSWSHAINLGPEVNTDTDEKYPHLINQGKTLCFSSQSHFNMGGLDAFYIPYPIATGEKPKNIGYPLNTVNDDFSFFPVSENSGFISRYDVNNQGVTDIYKVEYSQLANITDIDVKIQIEFSGVTIGDSILLYLTDTSLNDTIDEQIITKNSNTTEYHLYPGSFSLKAKTSDNLSATTTFKVPEYVKNDVFQIPLSIVFNNPSKIPEPVAISVDTLEISNISFDFDSYILGSEYNILLDKVAGFMAENLNYTLTLTGYSDALGIPSYNKILSEKRAGQVLQYLEKAGINPNRMKTAGAGCTNFIAINVNTNGTDNATGRWYNRRVEFHFENIPSNIIIKNKTLVPENLR